MDCECFREGDPVLPTVVIGAALASGGREKGSYYNRRPLYTAGDCGIEKQIWRIDG